MTTGHKRWWRRAVIAAVTGCVVTGGWYGFVRATDPPAKPDESGWTRPSVPAAPPAVTQLERDPAATPAPPTGPVTPAGATLPVPPIPSTPELPVPPAPDATPPLTLPPAIDPVSAPRLPDVPTPPTGIAPVAAIPPIPSIPPAELPALPTPPKTPEAKPDVPALPAVPPAGVTPPTLPGAGSDEPMPNLLPAPAPVVPPIPQPSGTNLPVPPVQPAVPIQPTPPVKPDSDLNPNKPGNTLNPTAPPVAPGSVLPPLPPIGGSGRETHGTAVDVPKPKNLNVGATDKDVFPVPNPIAPPHRDDTMTKMTTAASFAIFSGAMLAAELAAAPPAPAPLKSIPTPGTLVKADEKTDIEALKKDLTKANDRIVDLEKQVKTLTELLKGKKDDVGLPVPSDPGAVEEIKRLKDKISKLEDELKALKTQTSLRPSATVPEAKPKGIVKVVNEYPVEISIVINDKSYRVAPNTKLDVEVAAGDFTYQLLQSGASTTRSTIKEKETVTLRIK